MRRKSLLFLRCTASILIYPQLCPSNTKPQSHHQVPPSTKHLPHLVSHARRKLSKMSSSPSDIPILNPRVIFGLKTGIQGNVDCITDDEIVYPVGGVLTVQDANQRRQKFIRLPQKGLNVTGILVSPNKKVIAVSERGPRPTVTLYDAQTYKKKRQIQIPAEREVSGTEFVAMCFTFDSKNLVAVVGEPDWELYLFRCDRGKIESSTRASNPNGTGTVSIVRAHESYTTTGVLSLVFRWPAIRTTPTCWCLPVINC